ncbi:MAG: transporter substrate-binding domain-containing protein [Vallitaleaceae bacterium]|nr:transporter substrate-binding domain-containing protein [Vallitaleaceae bacterium]
MGYIRSMFILLMLTLTLSNTIIASEMVLELTEEEQAFIEEHPVIQVGIDPGFVPFEFIDQDGNYKGIAADYLELISKKTGLELVINKGLTWSEAYEKGVLKEVDLLPAISKTPEREAYFLFSNPFYYFQRVIVMKNDNTSISGIEDLAGLTVAVQKNSSHHSYLQEYPNINLSLYQTVEGALFDVANGSEMAYVGNLATTGYLIKANGLTDLKYVKFEAEAKQSLHFAVRNDWPELASIIDKALTTITEEEKIIIHNRWIGIDGDVDYGPIIQIALVVGTLVAVAFGVSSYWILKLKKEISKRIEVEENLLLAKKEAEVANQIKSSFLARMSHEIRTPLNAITGMAYLMTKTDVDTTQSMYLEKITQASGNMLGIINDILDFSKIEAGKVEIENVSFELDRVIQDVVNIVSFRIEEQGIGFSLSRDPNIPNALIGDSKRLEQILLNLINNAVKFTNEGGVYFDIRLVASTGPKCHLEFQVKDTGIGMSEEQVNQLFIPFSQADASINRRFGGTGLGLSIVKSLVNMMEGSIKTYSTLKEGSTFIINLSFDIDREKEVEAAKKGAAIYFQNIRTLVLEKTGANINMMKNYLGSFGMTAEFTTSQTDLIQVLEVANQDRIKPFDLVIIDYATCIEDGFMFVGHIRKYIKINFIPKIIMLLPLNRDDLFNKVIEYEIDMAITKPIIPSVLYNAIIEIFKEKAISSHKPVGENMVEAIEKKDYDYHLLVVEDNKTNQFIAKSILEQVGFKVDLADHGEDGLRLFANNPNRYQLILMDLHMPIMNGYDAAKAIRDLDEQIPIVAMTADAIMGVEEKCKAHGIDYYISKPFEPEVLLKKIIKIIEASGYKRQETVLDESDGLKYLGNNIELYKKVIQAYYEENQDTSRKLQEAIDQNNLKEAAQIVHKIKSSSGTIGAKKLHQVARDLQKALEDESLNQVKKLKDRFENLLKILLLEIESRLSKD